MSFILPLGVMKKAAVLCLLIQFAGNLCAQDLSGKWTGITRQNVNGDFALEVNISSQDQHTYTGSISTVAISGPFRGRMTGKVTLMKLADGKVSYQDGAILDSTSQSAFYWCLKEATLSLSITKDSMQLSGSWASPTASCPPGTMRMVKVVAAGKAELKAPPSLAASNVPESLIKKEGGKTVKVRGMHLEIEIWDFDALDEDSVSLKLNGKQVGPKEILLPAFKRYGSPDFTYPLELSHGDNILEIFAKNEGLKPNNTVGLLITDDETSQRFFFSLKAKETSIIHFLRM